jgi:hypothetical protein
MGGIMSKPKMPAIQPLPPAPKPGESPEELAAAAELKKRNANRQGRQSTILTGLSDSASGTGTLLGG